MSGAGDGKKSKGNPVLDFDEADDSDEEDDDDDSDMDGLLANVSYDVKVYYIIKFCFWKNILICEQHPVLALISNL